MRFADHTDASTRSTYQISSNDKISFDEVNLCGSQEAISQHEDHQDLKTIVPSDR